VDTTLVKVTIDVVSLVF